MAHVDVLVGNEEDLQKGLGIPGPEVAAKSKLDPSAFFGMIDRVVEQHPAGQDRGDDPARGAFDQPAQLGRRRLGRRPDPCRLTCDLDVHDRVGGGDGFASGFFYGLLTGESPEEALQAGLGARGVADDVPRRHHDGDAGAGEGVGPRRIGTHPTLMTNF